MRKGGDGAVFTEGQALAAGWPNGSAFQGTVGFKPGDQEGIPRKGIPLACYTCPNSAQ